MRFTSGPILLALALLLVASTMALAVPVPDSDVPTYEGTYAVPIPVTTSNEEALLRSDSSVRSFVILLYHASLNSSVTVQVLSQSWTEFFDNYKVKHTEATAVASGFLQEASRLQTRSDWETYLHSLIHMIHDLDPSSGH